MSTNVRIPLAVPLECRDATLDKDGLAKNILFETTTAGPVARRRPGIDAKTSIIGAGNGMHFQTGVVFTYTLIPFDIDIYGIVGLGNIGCSLLRNTSSHYYYLQTPAQYVKQETVPAKRISPLIANASFFIGRSAHATIPNRYTHYISANGLDWTASPTVLVNSQSSPQQWAKSGATNFCSLPNGNYEYSSDNGATWTENYATVGSSIAASNSIFTTGQFTSATGGTWTACPTNPAATTLLLWVHDPATIAGFWGVRVDGFGNYNKAVFSSTGFSWGASTPIIVTGGTYTTFQDFASTGRLYTGKKILVWNQKYEIMTSTDGITFKYKGVIYPGIVEAGAKLTNFAVIGDSVYTVAQETATGQTSLFKSSNDGDKWTKIPISNGEILITQEIL